MDSKKKSFCKSITWRILAFINGTIITAVFIEDISKSVMISVIANITGLFLYYVHERFWIKINI